MTHTQFEDTLRGHLYRDPFSPFVVRLKDGRQFAVDEPAVAYNGKTAVFISEHDGLIDFSSDEVAEMMPLSAESKP